MSKCVMTKKLAKIIRVDFMIFLLLKCIAQVLTALNNKVLYWVVELRNSIRVNKLTNKIQIQWDNDEKKNCYFCFYHN
jgi:hypothetical protein